MTLSNSLTQKGEKLGKSNSGALSLQDDLIKGRN